MIIINGSLAGNKNGQWKGGKHKNSLGYTIVCIPYNSPFTSMRKGGHDNCILEHRFVMANYLSRCLEPWEIVHHINGKKNDNRIENLEIVSNSKHLTITKLMKRIKELEEENRKLKCSLISEHSLNVNSY